MRKPLFIFAIVVIGMIAQAQEYVFDKVFKTTSTKSVLYARAKMAIVENFRNEGDVIQNEDKEKGVILAKSSITVDRITNMGFLTVSHTFRFSLKIMVKDNKYRIVIEDIYNPTTTHTGMYGNCPNVPVFDFDTKYSKTNKGYQISKKSYKKLMDNLEKEIIGLFVLLQSDMEQELPVKEDW